MNKPKNSRKCAYCKKKGHSIEKCWKKDPSKAPYNRANSIKDANKEPKKEDISLNSEDYNEVALSSIDEALKALSFNKEIGEQKGLSIDNLDRSIWLLDSGSTKHICAYRDYFIELKPCAIDLNWGKASNLHVKWCGKVNIRLGNRLISIRDCLYAPEIGLNLLSLGQLVEKGVDVSFKSATCELAKNGSIIARGTLKRNLVLFRATLASSTTTSKLSESYLANSATSAENSYLWHQRMGHIGSPALRNLAKATTGTTSPIEMPKNCEICIQSKAIAKISYIPMPRASGYLEKVHSDICGPISPETTTKKRYFISFIDDYSRYSTISLISTRDEAFKAFKEWLIEAEKQSGKVLKRLHTDNAKEYKSSLFTDYFKARGIIFTYSAPYNPEQNGISERYNRTLMNKVRALLITSGLPKFLWGEAAISATYLYNRTPNSSLSEYRTPYELKLGEKPNIANIRVWGSIAYKKEPKTSKLAPKATPHILIGYKGPNYRLIKPNTRLVTEARDVYILENIFIKDVLGQLVKKTTRLSEQLENIAKTPLVIEGDTDNSDTSEDIAISPPIRGDTDNSDRNDDTSDKWLDQFTSELKDASKDDENDENIDITLLSIDPTYLEAIKSPNASKWINAMNLEFNALKAKGTWTLVPKQADLKVLKGRWVLKEKLTQNGPIYKARWVAKGFQQILGVDFNETFANTANPIIYRLLFVIGAYLDWEIEQWDVKNAYPNASLQETIYVQQPTGFEDSTHPDYICLLKKALYGLKQSARQWEIFLKDLLKSNGFISLKVDRSVYISTTSTIIIIVYVDDLIVLGPSIEDIKSLYKSLAKAIEIRDLGAINTFLGIEIARDRGKRTISLSQKGYTSRILNRFYKSSNRRKKYSIPIPIGSKIEPNEDKASEKDISEFQQKIGSLLYLASKTRVDLCFPTGLLARYMSNPSKTHEILLEGLLGYLERTQNLGLLYTPTQNSLKSIIGYSDADWGGDKATRRSTTGYLFKIANSTIIWNSKLQKTVALSSCEAEYMAIKEALKEMLYIKAIITEIGLIFDKIGLFSDIDISIIYSDSESAIELAKNPVYHARSKHIDIQYHFIRENVQQGSLILRYIPSKSLLADGLTKPIPKEDFNTFIKETGLTEIH